MLVHQYMEHITAADLPAPYTPVLEFNGVFDTEAAQQMNVKDRVAHSTSLCSHCKALALRSLLKVCGKDDGILLPAMPKGCLVKGNNFSYGSLTLSRSRPQHKSHCIPGDASHRKLVRAFVANPLLMSILHMAIILDMKLHEENYTGPFTALVQFNVLPASPLLAFGFLFGDIEAMPNEVVSGMLQIGLIRTSRDPAMFTPGRMETWRGIRTIADDRGQTNDPIAWILLGLDSTSANSTVMPSQIPPHCFEAVRNNKTISYTCPRKGIKRTTDMSMEGCIRYINWLIQADHTNLFRLRSPMTKFDFDVIKNTARLFVDGRKRGERRRRPGDEILAVRALYYRMTEARDPLYASNVQVVD